MKISSCHLLVKYALIKTLKLSFQSTPITYFLLLYVYICTQDIGGTACAMAYKWMSDENFLESEPVGSRDQTQVIRLPVQVLLLTETPQLAHKIPMHTSYSF